MSSRLNQCRLVCHTLSQVSLRFNILRPNVFKDQSSFSVLTAIAMKVSATIICVAFDVVSRICDFVLGFKLISVLAKLAS